MRNRHDVILSGLFTYHSLIEEVAKLAPAQHVFLLRPRRELERCIPILLAVDVQLQYRGTTDET